MGTLQISLRISKGYSTLSNPELLFELKELAK